MSETLTRDDPLQGLRGDRRILAEAKARHKKWKERESKFQSNFCNDMKFANGDSYNGWQWPDGMIDDRGGKPSITTNKVRQHCLQIVNDARQNKGQVEIRPVGNGATFEAAQIFEGIVRHIEYVSNAQAAYDCASWNQVIGGIGWWRVLTDYAPGDSFDQEIYIRRVPDALSVGIDVDIQEYDGSDARYGFVFRDMPRDEYRAAYPKYANRPAAQDEDGDGYGVFSDGDGWDDEDHVRVCEYYYKTIRTEKIRRTDDGRVLKEADDGFEDDNAHPDDIRDIERTEIKWCLIAGGRIVERKIWPGNYIPLVRVIGEEFVVDKQLDRRGHVRMLIDDQRMYNYWSSSAVEFVAFQSKVPWLGTVEAFEGIAQWENANTETRAFLAYNGWTEDGREIPPPKRTDPPVMAQAFMEGLKIAAEGMRMASGQYQTTFGEPGNERSGKAIQERQRQGDNATYHFIEHLGQALRYTGKILVDLIPKLYDTERVLKILGMDGEQSTVLLDPNAPDAHAPAMNPQTGQPMPQPDQDGYDPQQIARIFNPNVGTYEVIADMGPAYATKRQEAFNAMTQVIQGNAGLMPIVGDLMFKSADFPLADEIAERLKRMVPPQAMNDGPDPRMAQMEGQLQQAHAAVVALQGQLQQAEAKALAAQSQATVAKANAAVAGIQRPGAGDPEAAERAWFDSETKRMAVVGGIDPAALLPLIRSMVSEVLGRDAMPLIHEHQMHNQAMMPQPAPVGAGP